MSHKPTCSLSGSSATACFACNGWELREEWVLPKTDCKEVHFSRSYPMWEKHGWEEEYFGFPEAFQGKSKLQSFFGVQLASYQWVRLLPNKWNNSLKGCVVLHMRDCAEWCYKLRGRAASSGQVASTVFPSYQRRGSTNLIFGSKDSVSLPGHTSTTDPRITVTVIAGDDLEATLSGGPWLDKWILTTLWLQWDQQFTNRFANHTKSSCACKARRKGNWV